MHARAIKRLNEVIDRSTKTQARFHNKVFASERVCDEDRKASVQAKEEKKKILKPRNNDRSSPLACSTTPWTMHFDHWPSHLHYRSDPNMMSHATQEIKQHAASQHAPMVHAPRQQRRYIIAAHCIFELASVAAVPRKSAESED